MTSIPRTRTGASALSESLQKNVLALVACCNEACANEAASRLRHDHFDGFLRDIASAVLDFRQKHGTAPGDHLVEIVCAGANEAAARSRKKLLEELVVVGAGLNAAYVAGQVDKVVRLAELKAAVVAAGDRLMHGEDQQCIEEVEALLLPIVERPRHGTLVARAASEFEKREVEWLDHPFFLVRHINLITGEGGIGKTLITLDVAAAMSMEGKATIFLTIEDDPGAILGPRLQAAGGNPDLLLFVGHQGRDDDEFDLADTLDDDKLAEIERIIKERGDVGMVVIDPLVDFSRRGLNHYSDSDVRESLKPLRRLAQAHNLALVIIVHFNKKEDLRAVNRTAGSMAYRNLPRSVLMVLEDRDEPGRILMIQTKKNHLAQTAPNAIGFVVLPKPGDVPVIKWEKKLHRANPDEVLAGRSGRPSKLDEAREQIEKLLAGGPMRAADLKLRLEAAGIGWTTARKVKSEAGATSYKQRGQWYWELGGKEP